jgi:hypothetical protein
LYLSNFQIMSILKLDRQSSCKNFMNWMWMVLAPETWSTQSGFTSAIPISQQTKPRSPATLRPKSLTIGYSKKENDTKILKLATKKIKKTSTIHKQKRKDCNSCKEPFLSSFLSILASHPTSTYGISCCTHNMFVQVINVCNCWSLLKFGL